MIGFSVNQYDREVYTEWYALNGGKRALKHRSYDINWLIRVLGAYKECKEKEEFIMSELLGYVTELVNLGYVSEVDCIGSNMLKVKKWNYTVFHILTYSPEDCFSGIVELYMSIVYKTRGHRVTVEEVLDIINTIYRVQ